MQECYKLIRDFVVQIVSSEVFVIIGIPLLLLFAGIYAKRLGRRDNDNSPRINDWAVSTTVLLMLLGRITADFKPNITIEEAFPLFVWMFIVLILSYISMDHDRWKSWVRDDNKKPTNEKHLWYGVLLPNFVATLVFVTYQAQKLLS
ncbi:MAG: hypothetical protein AAF149_05835 [Bacteroidota bacterium]